MIELTIDRLGGRGDGIAESPDGLVYVPYAVPGDRLRVSLRGRRGQGRLAQIEAVLRPGPDRVSPPCPHFADCGGCVVQHLADAAYRRWKVGLLREALLRRGLADAPIADLLVMPPAGRRRARFAARRTNGGQQLGFNAGGSRRIVDLRACLILRPAIVEVLAPLRELLSAIVAGRQVIDVQVTETDSGLDLWLLADLSHGPRIDAALAEFAEARDLARLSVGLRPETLATRRDPRVVFAGVSVRPPADAFLQASRAGEAALTRLVEASVGEAASAADLYAGLGTFSFALGRRMAVRAVEGAAAQAEAVVAARNGATGLRPIEVEVRDLARRPLAAAELAEFDAVVFDPPRAGAARQAAELAASPVPRVVAVSCNPATFARDARTLVDGGYRLRRITPLDQFPWSRHLELVGDFAR
ncbi:MAG: class I SAM-dependent RNA methyltransferase [Alphaproteobacteria bacterium]|jgi:23S rRNA (uracil1939-C5)-methyltransferase|nr:class I SAM-dependent RNA methyltransferase [Alphaproteobacteria bacterium]MDP6814744.1 class I SAM-dependent RNA methyltransferase [Alphaproteobacteria bacterium]